MKNAMTWMEKRIKTTGQPRDGQGEAKAEIEIEIEQSAESRIG